MLSKWKNTDESVYHSDQFVSIWKKIVSIVSTDNEIDSDDISESDFYESFQRSKYTILQKTFNE